MSVLPRRLDPDVPLRLLVGFGVGRSGRIWGTRLAWAAHRSHRGIPLPRRCRDEVTHHRIELLALFGAFGRAGHELSREATAMSTDTSPAASAQHRSEVKSDLSTAPVARVTRTVQPGGHLGSELERKAAMVRTQRAREKAERDRFIAQQKAEATTLTLALAQPCPEHDAAPGKPCWRLPGDDKHHRAGKGVCGLRTQQALGVAKLRRERLAREAEREARQQAKAKRSQR